MTTTIEPIYSEVGRRIREYRMQRHLTQEQLGARLTPSTTRISIANVESGKQRILLHTIVQFAEVLQVELFELLPAPQSKTDNVSIIDIANELSSKVGLSLNEARNLVNNSQTLKTWNDESI